MKVLEKREREIGHWEELLNSSLGGAEPSDILHLSVGGRTGIAVLRRTLTTFKDSMLAAKFSGRWDDSLERDKNGYIFIDQDPDLFITLINYLRDKGCESEGAPNLSSPAATNPFCRLVPYYGLTWDVYPIDVVPTHGNTRAIIEYENYPQFSISSSVMEPFDLVSVGHNRGVRSYEIEVGHATKLQVGWRDKEMCFKNSPEHHSVFLDCIEKGILNYGREEVSPEMENVGITNGTKLRCSHQENSSEYKWCIGDATELVESHYSFESPVPCFIFCGTLRVTHVQYE